MPFVVVVHCLLDIARAFCYDRRNRGCSWTLLGIIYIFFGTVHLQATRYHQRQTVSRFLVRDREFVRQGILVEVAYRTIPLERFHLIDSLLGLCRSRLRFQFACANDQFHTTSSLPNSLSHSSPSPSDLDETLRSRVLICYSVTASNTQFLSLFASLTSLSRTWCPWLGIIIESKIMIPEFQKNHDINTIIPLSESGIKTYTDQLPVHTSTCRANLCPS